jgi:NitT/TauT family transport system permease protein
MGRSRLANRLADPWLIVLLNLPALVIIVLAYIWAGLTETAAVAAVALNKLPIATVTVREGARSLDTALDEMAQVFRMRIWMRIGHIVLPQLAPYLAAAARSGLSLVQRRRLRDRGRIPAVRRYAHPGLCSRLRRGHARRGNASGSAA